MENQPYVKTGESEIDYLVVEELFSSFKFQNWLLKKLNVFDSFEFIGAWKSYNSRFGECDIVSKFKINDKILVILIENKIYSPEQLNQAQRYHKTGQDLIINSGADNYITCLLCPKIYFKEDAPMNKYQHQIYYEELFDFFTLYEQDDRIKFKTLVIQNGIDRARTGYQRFTDNNTDNFYEYYEQVATSLFPQLEFKKPKEVASGNYWIRINPKLLPAKTTIIFKAKEGYIDLQISHIDLVEFTDKYKNLLNSNMTIHKTGKSFSIRMICSKLPKLEEVEHPEEFRTEVIESLNKANELFEWFKDNNLFG